MDLLLRRKPSTSALLNRNIVYQLRTGLAKLVCIALSMRVAHFIAGVERMVLSRAGITAGLLMEVVNLAPALWIFMSNLLKSGGHRKRCRT